MANINGVNPPVLNDTDYVNKIFNAFTAIDNHDHSSGKGLPIGAAGIGTGAIVDANVSAAAAIQRTKLLATGANKVPANDASGFMVDSTVNKAELERLSGITSTAVGISDTQTLTNKTVDNLQFQEQVSAPSVPASGFTRMYVKADGLVYKLDSLGVETQVGASGGGGSVAADEFLLQKLDLEYRTGQVLTPISNTVGASGRYSPASKNHYAAMLENYASGVTSLALAWNPVVPNDSDKQMDATTNWTAVGQATSLATNATAPKLGTNSLLFDKAGSGTEAGIRYDRSSQNLNLQYNTRALFWVNLPSLTNLSDVYLRIYADSTSNYRTWTKTVNLAGGALATGWQLMFVDLGDTTGSTATGTGWVSTQASRYVEIGVTTSSSGQTYSGIKVDGLMFSWKDQDVLGFIGQELTIYNNTVRESVVIDSTNTRLDGPVTLAAATSNAFNGGISNSDATKLVRSLMASNADSFGFDGTPTGAAALEQGMRIATVNRASVLQNLKGFVDVLTPQVYKMLSLDSTTGYNLEDVLDQHLDLLSGDVLDFFTPNYVDGELKSFTYSGSKTLTGNATYLSGVTTIACTQGTAVVGDFFVKRHIAVGISLVARTANENFQTPTATTDPDGKQLVNQGANYPQATSVYAHWRLGGQTSVDALRQQKAGAAGPDLVMVGTPNIGDTFRLNRKAASGFTTGNYLRTPGSYAPIVDGVGELIQISYWLYFDGTLGATRNILSTYDASGGNKGWVQSVNSGASVINTQVYSSTNNWASTSTLNVGWNHVLLQIQSGVILTIFINGVKNVLNVGGDTITGTVSQAFYLGVVSGSASVDTSMAGPATGMRMADMVIWKDGNVLTDAEVRYILNAGPLGFLPRARYSYELANVTGQKLSMKAALTRSTSAVSPAIALLGTTKI